MIGVVWLIKRGLFAIKSHEVLVACHVIGGDDGGAVAGYAVITACCRYAQRALMLGWVKFSTKLGHLPHVGEKMGQMPPSLVGPW